MCIIACKYSMPFTKRNFWGLHHPLCSLCNKSLIRISVFQVLLCFRCGFFPAWPSFVALTLDSAAPGGHQADGSADCTQPGSASPFIHSHGQFSHLPKQPLPSFSILFSSRPAFPLVQEIPISSLHYNENSFFFFSLQLPVFPHPSLPQSPIYQFCNFSQPRSLSLQFQVTSPFLLFTHSRWRDSTTNTNHENHWEREQKERQGKEKYHR